MAVKREMGALYVPTAEWSGIDIDEDQKAEWVKQFESPFEEPSASPAPASKA